MAESESDDEDVSFIEEIKSPPSTPSTASSTRDHRTPRQARPVQASGVRNRLSFPGFADPVAVSRRPLAAKKEAQEAEETRINNILIEAGIDPAEFPDLPTRKVSHEKIDELVGFSRCGWGWLVCRMKARRLTNAGLDG